MKGEELRNKRKTKTSQGDVKDVLKKPLDMGQKRITKESRV